MTRSSPGISYLMTSVRNEPDASGEQVIRNLLGQGCYVFSNRTRAFKHLKPGDRLCFYWSRVGVVAEVLVSSSPESSTSNSYQPDRFNWIIGVSEQRYFFNAPVVIDAALRAQLDAFQKISPERHWSWFVQGSRFISEHDFHILTGSFKKAPTPVSTSTR